MIKNDGIIEPEFSEFYRKLCMTKEIRREFGAPIVEGNFCIYKNDINSTFKVIGYPGESIEIDMKGNPTRVSPDDLTWLPTVQEIRDNFFIQEGDGFWHGFENFNNGLYLYGYSQKEFSQFSKEEERWLIFCMVTKREKKFKEDKWIPFKYQ